ncbi:MAG: hypothetical protein JRE63_12835 [Deltaproteobacteria bacterium]|jgi:hypothetical protein|nr:hypothetical protein [Deltaproteobacteria bacterium]
MRIFFITLLSLGFLVQPVLSEEITVGSALTLTLDLPTGWTIYNEAPEALIVEVAEHVEHEAEAQGKSPSQEQILEVAKKRLAANEAIVYHASSGSHLDIDFSPLEENETPPSSKLLKQSAEFAVQSLEGEEGVSGVEHRISPFTIPGSSNAFRIDADYRHHDEPVRFSGIIGYAERHWYFFYFTAPGKDADAVRTFEDLIKSFTISPGG